MAGMGPAPKDPSKRARTNTPNIAGGRKLPAEGRKGQQPGWPLAADVTLTALRDMAKAKVDDLLDQLDYIEGAQKRKLEREYEAAEKAHAILAAKLKAQRSRERTLWNDLWRTPQACAWEQLGWTREVAMYVRHTVLGELGDLDQAKEARQWSDRLGLSPMAMRRLGWEVVADEVAAQRAAPTAAVGARARRTARTLVAVGE